MEVLFHYKVLCLLYNLNLIVNTVVLTALLRASSTPTRCYLSGARKQRYIFVLNFTFTVNCGKPLHDSLTNYVTARPRPHLPPIANGNSKSTTKQPFFYKYFSVNFQNHEKSSHGNQLLVVLKNTVTLYKKRGLGVGITNTITVYFLKSFLNKQLNPKRKLYVPNCIPMCSF